MNPIVRRDLSPEAQQAFQVVALLATMLVVGIHYQSDVPDDAAWQTATWNQLAQEFLFGGVGRVAVPMFALAAGLFYFRSDDGSLRTYRKKLRQRCRTILLPFFMVGSLAMAVWLVAARIQGHAVEMSLGSFLSTWLLRPPAEQLWFLRDLMVLVIAAPLVRFVCHGEGRYRRHIKSAALGLLTVAWISNLQFFPVIAGWRLLHVETLFFFTLGCLAVAHFDWFELAGRVTWKQLSVVCGLWLGLIAARISWRADFDLWYANHYGWPDLLLHQSSVAVGCVSLFMIAWQVRCRWLVRLSGASFFIYLVHEFPLRAVVDRFTQQWLDESTSCWIVTPLVLIICYTAMHVLVRIAPKLVSVLTGGRTEVARTTANSGSTHSTPVHAV